MRTMNAISTCPEMHYVPILRFFRWRWNFLENLFLHSLFFRTRNVNSIASKMENTKPYLTATTGEGSKRGIIVVSSRRSSTLHESNRQGNAELVKLSQGIIARTWKPKLFQNFPFLRQNIIPASLQNTRSAYSAPLVKMKKASILSSAWDILSPVTSSAWG